MNKVIVIGSPGAGKSVFAGRLSEKTGLPLIHLDMIWHKPDKTHISREELDAFLAQTFLEDKWIMDGNYARTMEIRFQNADTIFFLDYPVEVCLDGIRQRVGKERRDMPWMENSVDEDFKEFVANYPKQERNKVYDLIEKYKIDRDVIIFKSRAEADEYLGDLQGEGVLCGYRK